jgi:hypothetical protein
MNTFKLIILTVFLMVLGFTQAQISVNLNIGKPPVWGPVVTTEEYYYLPDIDSYYDIHQSQFIYLNNGAWIRSSSLPRRYKSYDLNSGYVVVLNDYHGRNPYSQFKNHKTKYYKNENNWLKSRENEGHDNGNHSKSKKGNKNRKHD